jgi:two-component system, NarL family, invasion response regulator UvrY
MTAPEASQVDVLIVDDQAPFRSVARALVRLLPGWSSCCPPTPPTTFRPTATCGALTYIRKDDLTPALLRALPV